MLWCVGVYRVAVEPLSVGSRGTEECCGVYRVAVEPLSVGSRAPRNVVL